MFGLFKSKKVAWQATVDAGKTEPLQLEVKAGSNLLKSALEAGIAWPHDCRVGSCGSCRCKLKEGKVKELSDFAYVLTGEQLQDGMILACQAALKSDIKVEVELSTDEVASTAVSTHEAVIEKVNPLTHDIVELVLKSEDDLPRTVLAGQYAEVATADVAAPRSYSFAKAPENEKSGEITFYVRRVPGGEFTEWLFKEDRVGTSMTVSLPYGAFWLRPGEGPIICIAGGSGVAPIKALLESAANAHSRREVLFVFGARTQQDLYCLDEMQAMTQKWRGRFRFIPVLSAEPEDSDWQGARGMVTDYLQQTHIETGDVRPGVSQAYLCGPPAMIDAAVDVLTKAGVAEGNIHFDKFLDASSMPGGRA